MKFLINKRLNIKKRAHYWNGTDTLCRMFSTGGLRSRQLVVADTSYGMPVCSMCRKAAIKQGLVEERSVHVTPLSTEERRIVRRSLEKS